MYWIGAGDDIHTVQFISIYTYLLPRQNVGLEPYHVNPYAVWENDGVAVRSTFGDVEHQSAAPRRVWMSSMGRVSHGRGAVQYTASLVAHCTAADQIACFAKRAFTTSLTTSCDGSG